MLTDVVKLGQRYSGTKSIAKAWMQRKRGKRITVCLAPPLTVKRSFCDMSFGTIIIKVPRSLNDHPE